MADFKALQDAIVDMQEEEALAMTRRYLDEGVDPAAVFAVFQSALVEIGKRFETNQYFIPELIMSGEIMQAASDLIKPRLSGEPSASSAKHGKVVIATVQGDIHDIGKNIAAMVFDLNGIEVKDLGVDVPAKVIVEKALEWGADIVGLSGLLTLAFDPMKEVVKELESAGLRDKVKVIIGGGQMDEQVRSYVGADAFVTDAVAGVNLCKSWLS